MVVLLEIHVELLSLLRVVKDFIELLMIIVVVVEFLSLVDLVLVIERFLEECAFSLCDLLIELAVDCLELVPHLSKGLVGATGRCLQFTH